MAKRKQRKQQRQTANPASEANEEGHSDEALEWSSIPGKRIHADIADGVALADAHSAKNIAHDSNDSDDSSTDQFNIQKWNSEHYDREDDEWDEKADNDLFNPDPHDRTNKFDPGSKFDGANDAGVFLRSVTSFTLEFCLLWYTAVSNHSALCNDFLALISSSALRSFQEMPTRFKKQGMKLVALSPR